MPKPINLITISGGEMLASSRGEDSSPPATVEEIQRRLVRPSSQSSTTDSRNSSDEDAGYGGGSIFQVTSADIGRDGETKTRGMNKEKKKKKKKKLEDYLDPVLLSAISSKLRRQRGDKETKPVRVCEDFKWPVEELKAFTEVSRKEKRSEWSRGAVNLNEDIDGDAVHDEDDGCNAFGQFEEIVTKLSKE